ncbi:hypothetical protein [Cerasibacillus terrae]|nr:hypothetical protein [Cerasibacillus terrae]
MSSNTRYKEKTPLNVGALLKVCEQYGISEEVISHFVVLKGEHSNE